MADAPCPDRLDDADLAALRHYADLAQAARATHQQAQQQLDASRQAAGRAEQALASAQHLQVGWLTYLNEKYALLGDRITPSGDIERVEQRRAGTADLYTPERRAVIAARVRRLAEESDVIPDGFEG